MSIYKMSAEERVQRALAAKKQREQRYAQANYYRALKQQEQKRQAAINKARVEEENKINSANPLLRYISTTGDIGANVTTGLLKGVEGVVDLGAGLVGAAGGIFSKDFREGTKKFISKDYVGDYVGKPLDKLTKYSYLNTTPGGDIVEGVASGVGQMLPTVAITIATMGTGTAPTLAGQAAATAGQVASKAGQIANMAYLTTSAAGNATESAFNDGAGYYEGLLYGGASGAVEGLTEKITGGFGGAFGKGLLDDVGRSIAKSTVGRVAKEAVGEGAEEVLAELANPALKSIYKGRDAFKEYREADYWKGVGKAGVIGAGTSLAYGGTVGHGVKRLTGVQDDVTFALDDLERIGEKRKALTLEGGLDENSEGRLGAQAAEDYRKIEEVLKKSSEKSREKYIKNYGLSELFESDGSMKEELREQVERSFAPERAVVSDEQGNERELARLDHRYSMLKDGKASTRIEAEEALKRSEATISAGELSATEAANLKKVRSFVQRLSDRGLVRSNLVVADMAGEDNGAVFGSTIVLNRKQLSKEDGWARTLIHEVEHLTEGTKEWDELARYLLASGNSDPAFDAVARNYFKGDETVGESALAKFQEGTAFSELTEQEQLFLTELIAHETEVLFGSERMLKRIAKEKRSLAKRLLERIEDFFRILKMSKEERKAFVKLEQARACLEKALWAAGDPREDGEGKEIRRSIVVLENGNTYVEASRNVIQGDRESERRKEITTFFEKLLKGNKTLDIHTIEGDVLTISKNETAGKARDNHKTVSGQPVSMSDDEFALKLRVEAHIDEIAETSNRQKGKKVDTKNHRFAKDGFTYRTAYFKDFDGKYYEISLSIGHNGTTATVYNVGNIKKSTPPSAKIIAVVGSQALDGVLSDNSIHQNGDSVKPDAKKSKADAEFESFDAEEFFREAAARSVSEVVGESEKSTKAPEAPLAPKKRGLSEGQAKKLEANYVNHKTFSRKEVAEVVDSITRKHLDFGEDYGVLIGKGRQEAIDALFAYLNTPGADHQQRAGEKIADLILENAIVKNIYEGLENEDAAQVVSALRPYLKRIDLESIKGDVEQKYGKDRSPFLRWGKNKRTADPVSADMVAKELEGLGIELHADRGSGNDADLFIAINEAYLSSMERLNTATRSKLKEVLSTDEGQSLKKQIVSDVQEALQSKGTVSKVQRAFESALKKATESSVFWKKEHEQQKKWTSAYNTLKDAVEKFDEVVSGKYGNVTAFKDERFKGSVGLLSKLIFRGNINVSGTRKTVGQILSWYTDENNKLIRENHLFEKDVEDKLRAIAEGEGTLKAEELKELTKVVGYFKNFVQNYDKVWRNGRFEDAGSSAKEMVRIIEDNRKYSVGWVMMLSGSDYAQMYADPMSVARRADMYNEKGFFTTMLTELKRGGIDAAVHEMDLQAGIREFEKSHKSYFKQAKTQTVEYHGGAIPKMVAIGLYMSYKRQQAQAGLLFNGFSYKDEKGVRVRRGGVLRADQEYSEGEIKVQIREEQRLLESAFSDADKAYIKALEEGYEKAKELKRSEDLLRLGYTNALEGYYYPIRRANKAQDLDSSDLADEFGRVNSASFNQNTVKGAKQELFLEPANAVFDRHAKAVALYRGIGHVLDTYNVLLNYDVGDNPNKPKSVATESSGLLREKKGSLDPNTAAVRYIKDLVSDLQGGRKQSGGLYSILRSKYAVAVLGLNPKSWMSQLSSLIVSTSILDPSSVAQGFTADTKDVDKYCRLAEYRNTDSTAVKAQGLIEGALDQTGQALMTPIGKMDRLVVCKLFGACQVQVAKDQKLKLGSEENKIAAGQLLEKVIMETQQGSIVTEKSAAMRSGSELQKTLTMFKSDIMKVSSRVVDSFGELVVLKKKMKDAPADQKKTLEGQIKTAKTNCFKAMGSMTASAIYLAAIAQAFRWIFRQDDEEEDKLQGFLLDCFGNMIGGLPFVSEAYGFFTNGYEVNSFAYTLINDVLEAGKSLGDLASDVAEGKADGKDMARAIKKLVLSMSQLAGIPAKNAYKLINGPVMRALEVASPGTVYKWDSLFFNQSYRKDLAKAVENEDEEMIATIAGLIMDESIGAVEDDTLRHTMNGLLLAGHDVLPQSVPGQISYDGETYQLDGKQQRKFRNIYGAAEESATALVKMRGFSKEDPETQAQALNFIYTTYYNLAKQEVLGVDLESKNVLFAEAIDVEILAMVICHCRSITADTDRSGKTVAGSKKAKIQTYVNSLGLSAAQKYMVMGYLGYTNKYGKGQVQAYINRLSLSREEKAELLEKSGYPEG